MDMRQVWLEEVEKYDLLLAHALIAPLQALRIDTLVFDQVSCKLGTLAQSTVAASQGPPALNPNKSSVSGGGSQFEQHNSSSTLLLSLE